ncbi:5'-3' exoribonuclease 1-like isoform 2-T3 [Glossina fuscipes fuscipes]
MGVPKFFRYVSERYPCLSELAREQRIPQFDNLYLDMNGIIHNCSHPDDSNIHFNITEEEMFRDMFNYVDKLFFLIKPRKLFFMAVDGVAPRAKMNQQRSRRFRSAKEAEILEKQALCRGEVRAHERFDSNCITPGTEFMDRLHEALRYFIKSKISSDPLWQKCRVILSGQDFPGEGEHKIMDYIRYLKSQADFNPNTRHCLYGLDADLIILGLCTHELHFVVLREEVKFGKKSKRTSVEETRFFLLHLGLLREYLELEFNELKHYPSYDIAQLIDDWVLMGFMVGNDFIPHLPCLHISTNALPLLYKTYIKVYPTLKGNINENGKLNLERLEKYFAALTEVEFDIFQENHADLKYFEAKQSKNGTEEAFDFDVNEINMENTDHDLAALIENSRKFLGDEDDLSDNDGQHIFKEFENYKRNYYMNKLNKDNVNGELKREQAICYITALQWVLDYYYRGVQSWDWYYPHHYAPFISDLKDFKDHKIEFNMGAPFLPFQQLLAVLPAASKNLLPPAYRDLMTNANSEVIHFYPENFETDLNGKQREWEAVVLIPFIDEKVLLHAMEACDKHLTAVERKRNQHGPMLQYDYHPDSQGQIQGTQSLKVLYNVFCTEKPFWSKDIAVSSSDTVCIDLPNAARSVFFPGFPTMKHLDFDFELKYARAKVFDCPSRSENMILKPKPRKALSDVFAVAEKYLNQVVYVGWPHLNKAKVVAVSSREKYIDVDGIKEMESKVFDGNIRAANEHLTTRMGIEINDLNVMIHVRTFAGSSVVCGSQGKVSTNEIWNEKITIYPAQGLVSQIAVQHPLNNQFKRIEQLFPENSRIFFIGNPYYGSEGIVMNPMLVYECGRLKVNITVLPEPNFAAAKYVESQLEKDYIVSSQASIQLGINPKCLVRLTGNLSVAHGVRRLKGDVPETSVKYQIGLQFKNIRDQEELAGYATRVDGQWFFSSKALALIQAYCSQFPLVVEYLSRYSERSEEIFAGDIFPGATAQKKIDEITAWLKQQDHVKAEKVPWGSKTLKKETVEGILCAIEQLKTLPVKTVKLQVKPHLLLKPDISLPEAYKAKRPIKLFDRVVVVKTTYLVPLGAKGTVIGVYPITDPNPVRFECVKAVDYFYEILFDKNLPSGNDIYGIAQRRVHRVAESSVLLIAQDNIGENETGATPKLINRRDKTLQKANIMTAAISGNNIELNTDNNIKKNGNASASKITTVTKSTDDFWTPSSDTKLKCNVAQTAFLDHTAVNKKLTEGVPGEMGKQLISHTETQALKDLLGLIPNKDKRSNPPALNIVSPNNPNKQLPQPPSYWRLDAQAVNASTSQSNAQIPYQYHRNFPPPTHPKVPQIAIPFNYALIPPTNAMPASNRNFNLRFPLMPAPSLQQYYQSPGQQYNHYLHQPAQPSKMPTTLDNQQFCNDKIFNSNSLNQKGAFIPLQVVRSKEFCQQQATAVVSNGNTSKRSSTDKNGSERIATELTQLSLNETNDNHASLPNQSDSPKPICTTRRKPPRIPKIGAKFDYA